ncbi:MAG: hypothetical protein AB7P40_02115 [Chloroflexota bacterium]
MTAGLLVTLAYTLVTYGIMRLKLEPLIPGVMSVTFLLAFPVAIGACALAMAPAADRGRFSVWYVLIAPWLAVALLGAITLLYALEAIICIVMALPFFLALATVGAFLAMLAFRGLQQTWKSRAPALGFLLLPYLLGAVEAQINAPDSLHVVHNSVVIEASSEAVWRQIIRVPAIGREEQRGSVLHWLGVPKPVEATLSYEGVGAVRQASFERGLLFVETVNEWQDGQSIGFSIVRDQSSKPPAPFGEIGGPYFDMLDGRYEIEPLAEGRVRLHLSSTHRVTTRFNWYAGLWTEPIMSALQRYILEIVKARSQVPAPAKLR